MDPIQLVEKIRAEWPTVSAAPTTFILILAIGLGLGWLAAWLILNQRLALQRDRIEHLQEVIADKLPAKSYKPIQFKKGRLVTIGLSFLMLGLVLAAVGTVMIISEATRATPTIGPLKEPPEQPSTSAPTSPPPSPVVDLGKPRTTTREFTKRTARELLALYEGRTPFQADKLIAPYKGQWIEVQGRVINILPDGRPMHSVAVLDDGGKIIECRIGPQWSEKINRVDVGDILKVAGRISESQNGSQLYLLDCDII